MPLPFFKYHPNPIDNGVIEPSSQVCICCQQQRGYVYTGPIYSEKEFNHPICPWCIENGEAHKKFNVEFTEIDAVGDYGYWEDIPLAIKKIIAYQTPSFSSWQGEKWWTHCGDAAQYLGQVDGNTIRQLGIEFRANLQKELEMPDEEFNDFLNDLVIDGSPSFYLFKCIHCGSHYGYTDND